MSHLEIEIPIDCLNITNNPKDVKNDFLSIPDFWGNFDCNAQSYEQSAYNQQFFNHGIHLLSQYDDYSLNWTTKDINSISKRYANGTATYPDFLVAFDKVKEHSKNDLFIFLLVVVQAQGIQSATIIIECDSLQLPVRQRAIQFHKANQSNPEATNETKTQTLIKAEEHLLYKTVRWFQELKEDEKDISTLINDLFNEPFVDYNTKTQHSLRWCLEKGFQNNDDTIYLDIETILLGGDEYDSTICINLNNKTCSLTVEPDAFNSELILPFSKQEQKDKKSPFYEIASKRTYKKLIFESKLDNNKWALNQKQSEFKIDTISNVFQPQFKQLPSEKILKGSQTPVLFFERQETDFNTIKNVCFQKGFYCFGLPLNIQFTDDGYLDKKTHLNDSDDYYNLHHFKQLTAKEAMYICFLLNTQNLEQSLDTAPEFIDSEYIDLLKINKEPTQILHVIDNLHTVYQSLMDVIENHHPLKKDALYIHFKNNIRNSNKCLDDLLNIV